MASLAKVSLISLLSLGIASLAHADYSGDKTTNAQPGVNSFSAMIYPGGGPKENGYYNDFQKLPK